MGTQTMASQGGGGQQSPIQGLGRQGSLYNLTLNEVQSHLGEPLQSMNLDDLLKNVFPAEGMQFLSMDIDGTPANYSSGSGIQHQGSITMNRAMSKKTVDEVWREIQLGQKKSIEERSVGRGRQPTLGEMTLEDFLVKAGVVAEGSDKRSKSGIGNAISDSIAGTQGFAQGPHWLQQYHQMSSIHQPQQALQSAREAYVPGHLVPQPLEAGTSGNLDTVYTESQVANNSPMMGAISDPQTPGRKRGPREHVGEKTVERRQKRMIKNRESAARSRARKQAYTNELENKVSCLEEENKRLKKQKELDSILHWAPPPEPKYQLRRSSSASF